MVYPACEVHPVGQHAVFVDAELTDVFPEKPAQLVHGLLRALESERYVVLVVYYAAFEVAHSQADSVPADVGPYEISCRSFQPVYARPAASGSPHFPEVLKIPFFDKLAYKLGHGRYAGVRLFAQLGDAVLAFIDAQTEDFLLYDGFFSVGVVQE